MNFNEFLTPEVPRKPGFAAKTPSFPNLCYVKAEVKKKGKGDKVTTTLAGTFYLSTVRFKELNIQNYGMRPFFHPTDKNTILLAVVNDADARFLKERTAKETKGEVVAGEKMTKGNQFKYDPLEKALAEIGFIDVNLVDMRQFIDMKQIGENVKVGGIQCVKVFEIVKSAQAPAAREKREASKDVAGASASAEATKTSQAASAAAPAPESANKEAVPAEAPADEWK